MPSVYHVRRTLRDTAKRIRKNITVHVFLPTRKNFSTRTDQIQHTFALDLLTDFWWMDDTFDHEGKESKVYMQKHALGMEWKRTNEIVATEEEKEGDAEEEKDGSLWEERLPPEIRCTILTFFGGGRRHPTPPILT